jgi:DNA-binding MarR family transcriptional regulator
MRGNETTHTEKATAASDQAGPLEPAQSAKAEESTELTCTRRPRPSAIAEQEGPTVHAIFRLSRMNKTMIGGHLRRLGLAPGQELLLLQLWERDECTQSDLVERLGLDPSTVTKMLQRLERDGWVRRSRSGDDGRATIVVLTDAGRDLRCHVTALWHDLELQTLGALSGTERAQLLALLRKVEWGLHASAGEAESPPSVASVADPCG